MKDEAWAEVKRGDRLRDRQGREWRVTADAYEEGSYVKVVARSGDNVRILNQYDAAGYEPVKG